MPDVHSSHATSVLAPGPVRSDPTCRRRSQVIHSRQTDTNRRIMLHHSLTRSSNNATTKILQRAQSGDRPQRSKCGGFEYLTKIQRLPVTSHFSCAYYGWLGESCERLGMMRPCQTNGKDKERFSGAAQVEITAEVLMIFNFREERARETGQWIYLMRGAIIHCKSECSSSSSSECCVVEYGEVEMRGAFVSSLSGYPFSP